jgi:hypothetical protein
MAGRVGERPVSDHKACGREMLQRTAKSCGPDAPMLASSSRSYVGPTGLRQNISVGDGGKQARSPGRARRKPLKPLRAGTPGDSGVLVVTRVRSTTTSAHEAAGATGIRRSPRPLWAEDPATPRAHRVARAKSCQECEAGMRETSLALPATLSARPGRKPMAPGLGPQHQRRAPHFPPDMPQFRRPGPGLFKTAIFLLRTGWPML